LTNGITTVAGRHHQGQLALSEAVEIERTRRRGDAMVTAGSTVVGCAFQAANALASSATGDAVHSGDSDEHEDCSGE
jgi:hypothetical protein